jgi:hypothetical protein
VVIADHTVANLQNHGAIAPHERFERRMILVRNEQFKELGIGQARAILLEHSAAELLKNGIQARSSQRSPSLGKHTKFVHLILPVRSRIYTLFTENGPD